MSKSPTVTKESRESGDSDALSTAVPPRSAADLYINREISWLAFNRRVLEEAWDERHPLLERVKFLAIFGSNLDEFFMIRVSGLQAQRAAGVADIVADGLTPTEALRRIAQAVNELMANAQACWRELQATLRRNRIEVLHYADLTDDERLHLSLYFESDIFPILTPLAVDPGHPFPHISNLSLNLAIVVSDPTLGERFARMKIPGTLPRLLPIPGEEGATIRRFVWLEDVISFHVAALFPGLDATAAYPFRVTRNADIEIQEDEAEDLLRTVEEGIRERHFGFVTRMEISPAMPERIRQLLVDNLEMDARNVVVVEGEMGHSSLMELGRIERPDLKFPPFVPRIPPVLTTGEDFFSLLGRQDLLLHHPTIRSRRSSS